jgi:virginiamycin B lyase
MARLLGSGSVRDSRRRSFARRFAPRFATAAAVLVAAPLLSLTVGAPPASASGDATVSNFTAPTVNVPLGIAVGADGALWFTNLGSNSIGRITTSGVITNFAGVGISEPEEITAGPDGALWFVNFGGLSGSIGRITTSGTITSFTDPGIEFPQHITAGPDGALWFTNTSQARPDGTSTPPSIGRITTAGVVTKFTDAGILAPDDVTAGPDGAVWFINAGLGGPIGRITSAGVVTTFTSPAISHGHPQQITAGPDGALWFTTAQNSFIGRITTAGTISIRTDPTIQKAYGIASDGSGALWFTNTRNNSIGRITTAGRVVTNYTGTGIAFPTDIVRGPDGAMWFTNQEGNSIGRIAPPPTISCGTGSVAEGNSGTTNLNVPVTLSRASTQTVTVNWSTGVISGGAGNQADPATDYTAASGTVTFAPGATTGSATISVNGDTLVEADEYLALKCFGPVNATMAQFINLGFGVIVNDD